MKGFEAKIQSLAEKSNLEKITELTKTKLPKS